jgi:uracil-DNA glycosylase family protein
VTESAEPVDLGADPFVPSGADAGELAKAVQHCRGCDLYREATQAVFSRGPLDAPVVMVGEQPGDAEDEQGAPFVGPAGHLLVKAIVDAGIDKDNVYVTNAVKHFKFERRGKRRIHMKPSRVEVVACRPWLLAEFRLLTPRIVVALGATAGSTLVGPSFRVSQVRGQLLPWPDTSRAPEDFPDVDGAQLLATVHPSAVLRAPDRDKAYAGLVNDLRVVAAAVSAP